MPIYEFKCLQCGDCFEFLLMKPDDQTEMRCPKCRSEDFERILSCTSYCLGNGAAKSTGVRQESRQCSGGSCSTWELPGHSR
jgi:putative FmdB family regulatory protein